MDVRPFVVGGIERRGARVRTVRSPYDGSVVAEISQPGPDDLEDALGATRRGFQEMRALPAWRRGEMLLAVADRLAAERERFARTIALEAGKPIALARAEVDRATWTFRFSGEEARRIEGETIPLDAMPGNDGRLAFTRRFPVGPVACITPFNFPVNLVAHKVAPALAAGCSFVLKPASQTPSSALDLARLLLDAGFPPEAVSVLPLAAADAAPLVTDPRIRAVSFTGSSEVGWQLRRQAFQKRVVLELGGNAGLIVAADADIDRAVSRAAAGSFGYAGQSCISVQRIFAHEKIVGEFTDRLARAARALVAGDPLDPATDVGPVIGEEDALRLETWIGEAIAGGARVVAGGTRQGTLIAPTVLTGTSPAMKVCAREAFGPLVAVEAFGKIGDAIAAVDASEYGLQAGIFTSDLGSILAAFESIEVGALVVNDVPTYRADHMPYGGVKLSGIGREGPRYAIEDFTESRLLVLDRPSAR